MTLNTYLSDLADKICDLYNGPRGGSAYTIGEAITQKEHALQSALLAEQNDPNDHEMIVAALLHDIGQLTYPDPNSAAHGINNRHEDLGYAFLLPLFGKRVATCVLNHVIAKRYLVCEDPTYLENLSPASQHSLNLQGGPFVKGSDEYLAFQAGPYFQESLRLRTYDDHAKKIDCNTKSLESYKELIIEIARQHLPENENSISLIHKSIEQLTP